MLFSHILEVLKDAPIFQMEYNIILRHLLAVNEYRYQMRKRVYCSEHLLDVFWWIASKLIVYALSNVMPICVLIARSS